MNELEQLKGRITLMECVLEKAFHLRECRLVLDHAASQGKSHDFMSQLRERYGTAGRELDRAVDTYKALAVAVDTYEPSKGKA